MPRYERTAKTYSSSEEKTVSHITNKKKQFDSMSDSGANKDEVIKQKLIGVMEEAGVTQLERSPIEPPPDVVKSTKCERRVVKKDGATSTSSCDKKRDDTSDEEHETHLPNVVNSNKRKRIVFKKERATSTSSRNKERNVKRKKRYVEEDDEDGAEVKVTGLRKSVEVYQEDFDDDLVDDEGHRSLEKKGNCTVIQEANTKLNAQFGKHSGLAMGNLDTVYSKEKCDDSMTTPPYLNVLTSLPCQTELMGGSTHAEGALQELEHPRYDGVKDELVLPSKDNRIILLKLQTIRIAHLKATESTSVSNK